MAGSRLQEVGTQSRTPPWRLGWHSEPDTPIHQAHTWSVGSSSPVWASIIGNIDKAHEYLDAVDFYSHGCMAPMQVFVLRTNVRSSSLTTSLVSRSGMVSSDRRLPDGPATHDTRINAGQLSSSEQRTQFAAWCFLKSPLVISAEVSQPRSRARVLDALKGPASQLSSLSTDTLRIVKNAELLAFNQDTVFGKPARLYQEPSFFSGMSSKGAHVFVINRGDHKRPLVRFPSPVRACLDDHI